MMSKRWEQDEVFAFELAFSEVRRQLIRVIFGFRKAGSDRASCEASR